LVDFNKLNSARTQSAPTDPLRIFQRLPKPPHINDLWESQSEALKLWAQRRGENDLVIKLNTGGGKTLVGLLIGQALSNELRQPVMYLSPNKQLVNQTMEKAAELGLVTLDYEPGPGDLPAAFLNASAILIATYSALFHGRSKFGVLGSGVEPVKVGAIICDDAHAAFSTVRDQFSISITRKDFAELYTDLTTRFRSDFEKIGKLGSFDDIVERQDTEILEIPYSAWASKADSIRQLLARDYADQFKYQLPLLRNHFEACHALVSSRDLSITALQPLIHLLPTFDDCPRRVYMSATIADDSSIIRTFDANPKAIGSPIVPDTLAGVGERMILAPSLTKLNNRDDLKMARKLAQATAKQVGSVVLVPSERAAERWKNAGTLVMGVKVEEAIESLVSGTDHGPFIFANRYDGIDLVGDACRLLVIDGLPKGANTYEIYRAEVLQASSSLNISLAQKIEQGMGRATRGAGDYCVVLLVGPELISWITRSDSLALMTPSTRAQVLMGHEISKSITNETEFREAIQQCLKRDPSWTRYHAETLADRAEAPPVDVSAIDAASVEREYARAFVARQFYDASQTALTFANQHHSDKKLRAWFLHLAARARYYAQDLPGAEELQRKAFLANSLLWAPSGMADLYVPTVSVGSQADNILAQIAKFALPTGHLQDFESAVSWLSPAASSNQLEDGLKRLGSLLGFYSERPEQEYGIGPDVLWLPDGDIGILIESKGGKKPKNALGKADHGQLLVSAEWFKEQYPSRRCIRVQVHPSDKATEPAMAKNTLALTFDGLARLVSSLRGLLTEVCLSTHTTQKRLHICEELLRQNNLTPTELIERYFAKFKVID
jgi:replicative superfamily II helicase